MTQDTVSPEGLNDNHRRRLLATCSHIDTVLVSIEATGRVGARNRRYASGPCETDHGVKSRLPKRLSPPAEG